MTKSLYISAELPTRLDEAPDGLVVAACDALGIVAHGGTTDEAFAALASSITLKIRDCAKRGLVYVCTPIPMLLTCPSCGARHIDEGEFETKVHHTHACQKCGMCWRPAVVPTTGVRFLPGFKNPTGPSEATVETASTNGNQSPTGG